MKVKTFYWLKLNVYVCIDDTKSGNKCTRQNYDEISTVNAPVQMCSNPSYEQCKMNIENNPAYDKPQFYAMSNPRGMLATCLSV